MASKLAIIAKSKTKDRKIFPESQESKRGGGKKGVLLNFSSAGPKQAKIWQAAFQQSTAPKNAGQQTRTPLWTDSLSRNQEDWREDEGGRGKKRAKDHNFRCSTAIGGAPSSSLSKLDGSEK